MAAKASTAGGHGQPGRQGEARPQAPYTHGVKLLGARVIDPSGRAYRSALFWRGRRFRDVDAAGPDSLVLNAADHLAFPGLINAHDHLHLNAFPAQAYGAGLAPPFGNVSEWVEVMRLRIDGSELRSVRQSDPGIRAWQGGLKNLLAGATVVLHHDPRLPQMARTSFPVAVPGRPWAHSLALAGSYGPPLDAAMTRESPGGSTGRALPFFLHFAEGRDSAAAAEWWRAEALGLAASRLRLVHGQGLRPADRREALRLGAGQVVCPVSSQRLFGHVPAVRDLARHGRVALGTDSRLTGARDLLAELGFAFTVGLADATTLWRMVGPDAARLCGLRRHGSLRPGMAADLVLFHDDGRAPAEQLCRLTRSKLRLVVRGGRPAVADLDFADLFTASGVPVRRAWVDGHPKLIACDLVAPLVGQGIEEPGLKLGGELSVHAVTGRRP